MQSDFHMDKSDKDYTLTHEQLIKVCRILLFKFNLSAKKSTYERTELAAIVNERIDKIEKYNKSNLVEVTTFLNTVHADFENFLNKHKKEHSTLNMRILKVSEDMNGLLEQFGQYKTATDYYAMVLACLVEFNSIEQALAI
jgi:hypothetical protein